GGTAPLARNRASRERANGGDYALEPNEKAFSSSAAQLAPWGSQNRRASSSMPAEAFHAGQSSAAAGSASPPVILRRANPRGAEMPKTSPATTTGIPSAKTELSSSEFNESFPSDVLHRVTYPKETLRMIAAWYTDSPENAGRIARINGIENPNVLRFEQEIRIPGYLLVQTDPMPQSHVQRYLIGRPGAAGAPR
ncbi:MAG TPA: hypothetical protein PLP17_12355, partial [Oligoflexia bacterium]|nr:hypothetical protein [Oligoflexia bacterium]